MDGIKNVGRRKKWNLLVLFCKFLYLSAGAQSTSLTIHGSTTGDFGGVNTYFVQIQGHSPNPLVINWSVSNNARIVSACSQAMNSMSFIGNCAFISVQFFNTTPTTTISVIVGSASASRVVSVTQPLLVGNLPDRQDISFNTSPGILPEVNATGGTGTITYQWQKSNDNTNWTNVGTANTNHSNLDYNPGNLTVSAYFRIRAVSGAASAFSNSMYVNVRNQIEAGTITYSQIIPSGTRPVILKGNPARGTQLNQLNGQVTYQWQQSSDGTNWTNISGAVQKDFWPPVLTVTTHYRRQLFVASVLRGHSNTATVTVRGNTTNNQPNNSTASSFTQPIATLNDLPNVTAGHFNRTVSFTTKRPGITLPSSLLNVAPQDGVVEAGFSDGAGRPVQSIQQRSTPTGVDVIAAVQYDEFGRTNENFLPYSDGGTSAANFRNNAGTQQRNFYNTRFPGEHFLYSKTVPADDMSGEVLSQSAPGAVFTGNNLGARSNTRIYFETEEVVYWQVNASGLPVANGTLSQRFYGNRDLMIEEAFDINGRRLIRYTDLMGRMVMEKIQNVDVPTSHVNGWNITYYVYDELGQLRFVLPSNAVKAALVQLGLLTSGTYTLNAGIINNLCFEFRYDVLGRVIYKKVPEVAHELYVYDQLGRQVLSQDAKQRITGQWSFIKFDGKDRPTLTGLWNAGTGTTESTIRTQAAASSDYPAINASTEVHTETYYDNYSFTGASAKPFNSALFNDIPTGTNAVAPTQSQMLTDLITGTRIRVFYPAGLTGPQWLTTINYYDNRERVIQTHSDNILGGTDVLSTRYNFTGDVLGQHYRHANPKPNANYAVLSIIKRNVYDIDGRLLQVFQRVNNEPERQLLGFEYNELGQLTRKILGPGAGANGTNLENLNYTYNLQGQLTGINANYARDRAAGHWWGTSLHYYDGFTQPKYDGTISGVVWRSRGKFDEANAYGFDYDVMSRLKQAYFTQTNAVNTSSGGWNQNKNFTTDNLNYDENGNIINMRSQSTAFGTTRTVDDLTYSYNTNSNRLTRVQDSGNGTPATNQTPGIAGAGGLKDFKDGNNTGDDYTYDANGNIISDANKNFTATYNHLDKPERIMLENNPNKDIRYVYDATGERLQKIVRHNDTVRTTTYVDGLTYLNDTTLLFFAHDGGRTRRNYKGRLVNDYFIEDHLGNTRMVLTDERDTVAYLAAFETNRDAIENAVWRNRNNTREAIVSGNAFFNNPNSSNTHYSRLNGNDAARRKGPGLVLKVMAGDTLNISTRALYTANSVPNTMATVNDMVTSILTGFLGAASGNAVLDNKAWLQTNNGVVVNTNAMNSFITNNQTNNSNTGTTPRAYLKYLLFDEDFNLVQGFAERIDNGANSVHTYTTGGQLVVPKNGFIYVFTTNESPVDVWFDDINVIHRTGPLLQESSFYPFGMEIAPLSSYAAIKVPNERDYQKNELDEEFGLELHYFDARMYDAQVGRFGGVDVKADKFPSLSPYNYSVNNPIFLIDPDGREPITAAIFMTAKIVKALTVAAKIKKAAKVVSFAAGGLYNTWKNRENIQNSINNRGFFVGLLQAKGYFLAGGIGAKVALKGGLFTAAGIGISGTLNIGMDYWSGELNQKSNFGDFLQSFAEGGSSALFGKSVGKTFMKPHYKPDLIETSPGKFVQKTETHLKAWQYRGLNILGKASEKGVQSFMDSYAEYGAEGMKDSKYGRSFYLHSFLAGFGSGLVNGLVDEVLITEKGWFGKDFKSIDKFSKGLANGLLSYESSLTKTLLLGSMNKKYGEYANKEFKKVFRDFFIRGSLQSSVYWLSSFIK